MLGRLEEEAEASGAPEFPPLLDLIAALFGYAGLLAAAQFAGGPYALGRAPARRRRVPRFGERRDAARSLVPGAAGLARDAIKELVIWTAAVWPLEIAVFLWPVGMVQVIDGTIDDGYNGILGWIWIACALTTIGLVAMTWVAAQGAVLLGRHVRDGIAVPRDPHRVRHRPHRPRRPVVKRSRGSI